MNKPFQPPSATAPMRSTAVRFTNGMIVTDDDLTAAMTYPVQLMQAVNRGVYGCGVACGFRFAPDPDLCGTRVSCDPCDDSDAREAYPGFAVQVGRGTAIDCYGMPIELCEPVLVDVTPERCGCEGRDGTVCIAVRRRPVEDAPRGDCCADPGGPQPCTRVRDYVELKAFPLDKLPDHICGRVEEDGQKGCGCGGNGGSRQPRDPYVPEQRDPVRNPQDVVCDCLRDCDSCDCCGEGWVLLGCISYCAAGLLVDNFPPGDDGKMPAEPRWSAPIYEGRKWIKPIDCLCGTRWSADKNDRDDRREFEPSNVPASELYTFLEAAGVPEDRAATFVVAGVGAGDLPAYIRENTALFQQAFKLKSEEVLEGYAANIEAELAKRSG
ncbi:MAG: hypothetical protein AAFR35_09835 [Pseudomonadota bacterium]